MKKKSNPYSSPNKHHFMPSQHILNPYLEKALPLIQAQLSPKHRDAMLKASTTLPTKFDNPNTEKYKQAFQTLPPLTTQHIHLNDTIEIGLENEINDPEKRQLKKSLQTLGPWRKGPFSVFGLAIDAEWQSNLKWNRLSPHLPSLKDQVILDIGCNSGYYMFRMAKHHPKLVIGVDPTQHFFFQFLSLQHYANLKNLAMLPIQAQALEALKSSFDSIFSMGILYHQRNPKAHLDLIKSLLKPTGWAIIETLILPLEYSETLFPANNRYAMMPNVYAIPTKKICEDWLAQSGFSHITHLDSTFTTPEEQRSTEWILGKKSLKDFIHPTLPFHTIEGYPGPYRASFLVQAN